MNIPNMSLPFPSWSILKIFHNSLFVMLIAIKFGCNIEIFDWKPNV